MNTDSVTIIATSPDEADYFNFMAELQGIDVMDTKVYEGFIPPNSYIDIDPFWKMARPEYMFLRKCNELDELDARMVGCELLSPYTSDIINPDLPEDTLIVEDHPHTDLATLVEYLLPYVEHKEVEKAFNVLLKVPSAMPIYLTRVSHCRRVSAEDFIYEF